MQRQAFVAVGLMVLAGLGVAGASLPGASCDTDVASLPAPAEVAAALAGTPYTLVGDAATLPAPAPGGEPDGVIHECAGMIRPGAVAIFNNAWLCTLNFIFTDPTGKLYVGTAGHCVTNLGSWTIRVPGVANDIGDPVYTTGDSGVGNDFALIRIDDALRSKVSPTMCRWGGPQGVHSSGGTKVMLHYGWGVLWGDGAETRGRAGLIQGNGFAQNYVTFRALAGPGDSGSPIIASDGKATAVLTHGSASGPLWFGAIWGTRIDTALARANVGGKAYRLVDSPVAVDLTGVNVPE